MDCKDDMGMCSIPATRMTEMSCMKSGEGCKRRDVIEAVQTFHKIYEKNLFSYFGTHWNHSEVFLEQKTAVLPSKNPT